MMRVAVRIFHPEPPPGGGGELAAWLHQARSRLGERQRVGFEAAGAADVAVISGLPDGRPFGRRLRDLLPGLGRCEGLVVLGSGAIPLAGAADRRRFVAAAADPGTALANNRWSADVVAIGGLAALAGIPDLATDNALPRWLETAGWRVSDLQGRWRLGIDLDSPLDIVLAGLDRRGGPPPPAGVDLVGVRERLAGVARVATDPGAELVVAGRASARTLAWLERRTACRTRALIEERGLRAGSDEGRRPASVLGALLDHEGPGALGEILARLGEGAVIDTRVLLAHRAGRNEAAWPSPEDRFASDLLLPGQIGDPWLRALTVAALAAPIPVLLGGHTLVGPGLRLALGRGAG